MHPRNPERNIWFSNLILVVWLFSHRCGEFAQYALKNLPGLGFLFVFFSDFLFCCDCSSVETRPSRASLQLV